MAREIFKNLPDTSTPINASKLNGIFNGEEPMGSIRVDDIECKQLFDKNNPNKIIGYINGGTGAIASNSSASTIYIKCLPSTTYTISKIAGKRFAVATFNNVPAIGSVSTKLESENTASSLTITSGENDNYLAVFYHLSGTDTLTEQEVLNSIQIEKGPVATEKVDFKKFGYNSQESMGKIVVDDIECKNLLYTPYTETNKLSITATKDDYWIETNYKCYLEAGKTYTISFKSDGEAGGTAGTDTVQLWLLLDKQYNTMQSIVSKEQKYTPTVTGWYYLRLDVNKNGTTHNFWDIQIEKGDKATIPYTPYKNFDNADVYKSISGEKSVSISDLPTYTDIINIVFNNSSQGIVSKASIGSKTTSNVQTLLGNPNIGNWGIAIFKPLYLEDSTVLIEVLAWAYYGGGVARGYLTRDNTGIFWTGWKNIATSGTMMTDTSTASTMSLRPDTTEEGELDG